MTEAFGVLGQAFLASDAMGKLIVIALLGASMVSISIILLKGWSMWTIRRACTRFINKYKDVESPLQLAIDLSDDDEKPLDCVCRAGINSVKDVLEASGCYSVHGMLQREHKLPRALTNEEVEKVRSSMVRQMNLQVVSMENMMTGLATIVTLAPFAGLLGTVWGVMMIFFQMGMSKRPEISDMAPGVSSAMLTTIIGLLVAMPAVFGNNMISGAIEKTCSEMEIFVDDFIASIQLKLNVKEGKHGESDEG